MSDYPTVCFRVFFKTLFFKRNTRGLPLGEGGQKLLFLYKRHKNISFFFFFFWSSCMEKKVFLFFSYYTKGEKRDFLFVFQMFSLFFKEDDHCFLFRLLQKKKILYFGLNLCFKLNVNLELDFNFESTFKN